MTLILAAVFFYNSHKKVKIYVKDFRKIPLKVLIMIFDENI